MLTNIRITIYLGIVFLQIRCCCSLLENCNLYAKTMVYVSMTPGEAMSCKNKNKQYAANEILTKGEKKPIEYAMQEQVYVHCAIGAY